VTLRESRWSLTTALGPVEAVDLGWPEIGWLCLSG